MSTSNVTNSELCSIASKNMLEVEEDSKNYENAPLEELMSTVEEQQRCIYVLLQRASHICTAHEGNARKVEQQEDLELSNLEATVAANTNLARNFVEKCLRSLEIAEEQRRKAAITAESANEELRQMVSNRLVEDIEAAKHSKSLEVHFNEIISERDSELSELRQQLMEQMVQLEEMKMQLLREQANNKGVRANEMEKTKNEDDAPGLLHSTLEALWQVTSEAKHAEAVLIGSPTILQLFHKQIKTTLFAFSGDPSRSLKGGDTAIANAQKTQILAYLPPIFGILVNITATGEGRKRVIEMENGELFSTLIESLRLLLAKLSLITELDAHGNPLSEKSRSTPVLPPSSSESCTRSIELILCIMSNVCAAKTCAVRAIELGMMGSMKTVVLSSAPLDTRRYAVNIVKTNMEYVALVGSSVGSKKNSSTLSASKVSVEDSVRHIGDIISSLSKDKQLRMVGLEMLGTLQRIMPIED